jgi:hypothetical protein
MQNNFSELIEKIQKELPDLITPDMLVEIGLSNHVQLFRIRQKGGIPFLKLSNARILYTKSDVILWLKNSYNNADNLSEEVTREELALRIGSLEEKTENNSNQINYFEVFIEDFFKWKSTINSTITEMNNKIEN